MLRPNLGDPPRARFPDTLIRSRMSPNAGPQTRVPKGAAVCVRGVLYNPCARRAPRPHKCADRTDPRPMGPHGRRRSNGLRRPHGLRRFADPTMYLDGRHDAAATSLRPGPAPMDVGAVGKGAGPSGGVGDSTPPGTAPGRLRQPEGARAGTRTARKAKARGKARPRARARTRALRARGRPRASTPNGARARRVDRRSWGLRRPMACAIAESAPIAWRARRPPPALRRRRRRGARLVKRRNGTASRPAGETCPVSSSAL